MRFGKSKIFKGLVGCVAAVGLMGLLPGTSAAKVTGQCAQCHTMHNSQNNSPMADQSTPYRALTKWDCVGCHTGTNDGTNNIPYVMQTSEPTYTGAGTTGNTLAGGNFYWVASTGGATDADGHNVVGIASQDSAIGITPPGWDPTFDANSTVALGASSWASQLTCAGTYGCHGNHGNGTDVLDDFGGVSGAHHGDDGTVDGSSVAKSYRFLLGIRGIEDSDAEYQPNASEHNQYMGIDKTDDSQPTAGSAVQTISYLCAECHGVFHSGDGNDGADDSTLGSPWLRHPTDYDMGNVTSKEYGNYNGGSSSGATYSVIAPVASDLDSVTSVQSTVFDDADDAIVTCISCHRAHGTPNADLLRWDYSTCDAGTDNSSCGCFVCHTTKDAG